MSAIKNVKLSALEAEKEKISIYGTIHNMVEDFLEGSFERKFKPGENQKFTLKGKRVQITIETK